MTPVGRGLCTVPIVGRRRDVKFVRRIETQSAERSRKQCPRVGDLAVIRELDEARVVLRKLEPFSDPLNVRAARETRCS